MHTHSENGSVKELEFHSPETIKEASDLLLKSDAIPLSGGTDVVVMMQEGLIRPQHLVDIRLLNLNYVHEETSAFHIGATTPFTSLTKSEIICAELPVLAEAASKIGSVQTRNMATIGGNICSAVPSADSVPPLLVLDASVKLYGPAGWRIVPLCDFFTGPRTTILTQGELLIEILIPRPPTLSGMRFIKLGRRNALTLAIVNVAVAIFPEPKTDMLADVRIALGAVAPTPMRAIKTECFLRGKSFSTKSATEAATIAATEVLPVDDIRAPASYRQKMTRVLVRRALMQAWACVENRGM